MTGASVQKAEAQTYAGFGSRSFDDILSCENVIICCGLEILEMLREKHIFPCGHEFNA